MKPVPVQTATMYLYGREAKADETPTAYVGGVGYVGAVLPKLPEWNKEKYTHAYLVHSPGWGDLSAYRIYFTYTPLEYTEKGFAEGPCWFRRTPYESTSYYPEESSIFTGDWTDVEETPYKDNNSDANNMFATVTEKPDLEHPSLTTNIIIWCNTDITYPNGTVFFEATEPVPVYE
jgi:hypothetical protein